MDPWLGMGYLRVLIALQVKLSIHPFLQVETHMAMHYIISPPPSAHLRLFWQEKNIKFHFPATMEQNIARVNLFRKPSDSSILRAIDAIDAIFSDQVNP
jgi:hypothetical protein